MPKIIKIA